ncbi:25501_t:CDS:2 [Gigaspora margarita]|uniref:25501_t:CDS:1 n=1 Tax=Gigaspora margarita TaxID=4874 RepID=A0ABM8VZZ1_GIGMA|nr:25501_t:CDS:2 [Gigaspora margarita]
MKKLFFSIFVSFVVYLLGIEAIFALPNVTSSNTTWIPISTQQNTSPDALDFYYLLFNLSYPAKGQLPIYIIVNPNGKTAPSQVSLSLYDEFNSIKLLDIANAPLTNHELATPFIIHTWDVASEIQSNFDFTSGYFTLVMSYNDGNTNVTKDRRIKLSNVAANPGGLNDFSAA